MNGNESRIKIVRTRPRKPWSVEAAEQEQKRKAKKLKKQSRKEDKRSESEPVDS